MKKTNKTNEGNIMEKTIKNKWHFRVNFYTTDGIYQSQQERGQMKMFCGMELAEERYQAKRAEMISRFGDAGGGTSLTIVCPKCGREHSHYRSVLSGLYPCTQEYVDFYANEERRANEEFRRAKDNAARERAAKNIEDEANVFGQW